MKTFQSVLTSLLVALAAGALLGCVPPVGSADPGDGDEDDTPNWPVGTIPVTFTIDDTANQVYLDTDGLAWKGSFSYDSTTEILTHDVSWGGPYVNLYDDGTHGDAVADDHVWTATVFAELPVSGDLTYEYGAIRGSVAGSDGTWIWEGSNGTVSVSAGATAAVVASGLVLDAFGTIDFKITLDTTSLSSPFDGSPPSTVEVKSSAWGWYLKTLYDDGTHGDETPDDDTYTMQFSEDQERLEGLLELDQDVEFVLVLDITEYKDGGSALSGGLTALTDWDVPGTFEVETVSLDSTTSNLELTVGSVD